MLVSAENAVCLFDQKRFKWGENMKFKTLPMIFRHQNHVNDAPRDLRYSVSLGKSVQVGFTRPKESLFHQTFKLIQCLGGIEDDHGDDQFPNLQRHSSSHLRVTEITRNHHDLL